MPLPIWIVFAGSTSIAMLCHRSAPAALGDYTGGSPRTEMRYAPWHWRSLDTAHFTPSAQNYDLSLVANRVPLSLLAAVARQARRSLPDDFTASGDLNAAFGFHWHAGVRDFHGTGMSTPFLLQASAGDKPFPVSAVRFHIGAGDTPTALVVKKKKSNAPAQPTPAVAPSAAYDSELAHGRCVLSPNGTFNHA